jgi:hypothetical protein
MSSPSVYLNDVALPEPPTNEVEAINTALKMLPPAGGTWAVPQVQQSAGIISGWRRWYLSPDEAIRNSRENARRMFLNLVIREPLQARLLATAELPWHIEPPNKKDPEQMRVAQGIQQICEEIPDFLKYRYDLLLAVWFGRYAVQNKYGWDFSTGRRRLAVKEWSPVHGDSLVYKYDSDDVGIYVGMYTGYPGTKELTTEPAFLSRAHVLTDNETLYFDDKGKPYHKLGMNERDAFVVHSHDIMAGDFLEPEAAGGVKGLGVRSVVYWTWLVMNEICGWMVEFLERVGTGITIWRYLRGNQESYNAVKEIAESQSNQAAVLFPVDPALAGKTGEDVERIEPSAVGIENMMKVLDEYYGAQIRRYLVGQDATSRPIPTGIGSKLAETHENTFGRIVKYDAINLQETLTHQLVRVIQKWSYPEATFKCKFVIDVEKPDVKEYMEGVKAFVDLGGEVDEDEVRSVLGLSKPDAGAKVLGGQKQLPGMPGMPGEEKDDEKEEQPGEGGPGGKPFRFRKRLGRKPASS